MSSKSARLSSELKKLKSNWQVRIAPQVSRPLRTEIKEELEALCSQEKKATVKLLCRSFYVDVQRQKIQ